MVNMSYHIQESVIFKKIYFQILNDKWCIFQIIHLAFDIILQYQYLNTCFVIKRQNSNI